MTKSPLRDLALIGPPLRSPTHIPGHGFFLSPKALRCAPVTRRRSQSVESMFWATTSAGAGMTITVPCDALLLASAICGIAPATRPLVAGSARNHKRPGGDSTGCRRKTNRFRSAVVPMLKPRPAPWKHNRARAGVA